MSSLANTDTRAHTGAELKILWNTVMRHWYLFAICLAMAFVAAYFYLRFTPPMYQVEAQVLIKDEKSYGEDILFAELGLGKKIKNMENEVLVLLSSPLMTDVVFNNNLQYRYFKSEGPILEEIYEDPPVRVLDWTGTKPSSRVTGLVVADEQGGYHFTVGENEYSGEFGGQLELPEGNIILWSSPDLKPGDELIVMALSVPEMVGYFHENLEVAIAGEESSTLVLNLKDPIAQRAHDVLMGLIEAYNKHSIDEKNKGYEGAIRLINERLEMISEELSEVEMDVEEFKSGSVTVELSAEGSLLMSEMAAYDHTISDLEVQLDVMASIREVLMKNIRSRELVPTNLSINSVTLSNELQSFNKLVSQFEQQERRLGPDHPELQLLAKQIDNLRKSIIDNLGSIEQELRFKLQASREQKGILGSRTRSLPRRERKLMEKERRKVVVENLYLYLLQKREESAISMAITTSTGSVVEPSNVPEVPVSPKRSQIWLISMFLGLALPGGIIMLMNHLNDKVEDATSIAKITSVPVLGSIATSRKETSMVVQEKTNSVVAEMFRLLRADLMYLTPGEDLNVLLITSSFSGEGKSFISMNLGMTVALTGKKVVIIELDLRKPKQEEYFGLGQNNVGVVNYLVDQNVGISEIITPSGYHKGLDVIFSGPIPPNPGELILSKRLRTLISELKNTYDFVILDSPPVGMVADALQLSDLPQATLYVVRSGYTHLPQLKVIEQIRERNKLPKPFIVLNGVRFDGASSYGGYGYGYFAEEADTKGLKGLWARIRKRTGKARSSA